MQSLTHDDLDALKCRLERETERKETSENEATVQAYLQLLTLKLYYNELVDAKFIWKTIPQSYKDMKPEFLELWKVGQALWKRDTAEAQRLLKGYQWPESVSSLINLLQERIRETTLILLSKAYSSISKQNLSEKLGLSAAEATELATKKSWAIDTASGMVHPKPLLTGAASTTDNKYISLESLRKLVSYLEN
ncbi:COP9 signalosome complex subunit 8-like [Watersipora subatra]|uniref:COP9 signalosome complex subunit 8-like n=1 Tax=Watersipora subatra TaxID=2589382 RepID=UPI00355B9CF1